jgi:hypothetical protein
VRKDGIPQKPVEWHVEERPFRAAFGRPDEAFRPGGRSPRELKPSLFFRINAGLKAGSSTKFVKIDSTSKIITRF